MAKIAGPLSYHIELGDGRVVRRHVDAVRARWDSADPSVWMTLPCPRMTYTFQPEFSHLHLLQYVQYLRNIVQLDHIHVPTTMDIDFLASSNLREEGWGGMRGEGIVIVYYWTQKIDNLLYYACMPKTFHEVFYAHFLYWLLPVPM